MSVLSHAPPDIDPLLLKAISLLKSSHPESTKQLNDLVQDYREKNYGPSMANKKQAIVDEVVAGQSDVELLNVFKCDESLADGIDDITNYNAELSSSLKIEESVEEITSGSSLEPKTLKNKDVDRSSQSDLDESISLDAVMKMEFDGPLCKVCFMSSSVEEDNSIIECSECHSHYHQKCHKPNLSTKNMNDPRLIWYCAKCTKQMQKEMANQQTASSKTVESSLPFPKALSNPFQQSKPFRRPLPTDPIKAENSLDNRDTSSPPPKKIRPRDMAVNSLRRLEQVKKRAKLKQRK